MFQSSDRFVPASSVQHTRLDRTAVLTASGIEEPLALTPAGEEPWMMLQAEREKVDRLVVQRGLGERVGDA